MTFEFVPILVLLYLVGRGRNGGSVKRFGKRLMTLKSHKHILWHDLHHKSQTSKDLIMLTKFVFKLSILFENIIINQHNVMFML